jgi:hypothetical protein
MKNSAQEKREKYTLASCFAQHYIEILTMEAFA